MKEKAKGSLRRAAMKSGMCKKTAQKYIRLNKTPEELKKPRTHRTRPDPFFTHWEEVLGMLVQSPTLEAKTIMDYLLERYPGFYKGPQLRTLQRRLSLWRIDNGSSKLAIFRQNYQPGRQSQSDWTHMKTLGITIGGKPFEHLLYHQVMSYSGFETFMICHSESFDTLTKGYEQAVLEAGGVCSEHRTDNLTAATQASGNTRIFTTRWKEFTAHYGVTPTRNNPGVSHENGIVEKSHDLFKKAVGQQLLLRQSRDFRTLEDYQTFLTKIKNKRNFARREKVAEEQSVLKSLPEKTFNEATLLSVCVTPDSLIRVLKSVYSVPSRLIGTWLNVYAYRDKLDLFLGKKQVLTLERVETGTKINYLHLIDSLIRKPGAFENYQHQASLFPNLTFRQAYDALKKDGVSSSKRYCELLYLAKMEGEGEVTTAIDLLLEAQELPLKESVRSLVISARKPSEEVQVIMPSLELYDSLLTGALS